MKKSKRIILAIAPVLGATLACGGSDGPQDRDVYATKEECVKDWSEGDLCEKMDENDERAYRGTSGGYFWGPVYYRGNRSVNYNGRTISGSNSGKAMKPFTLSSSSSTASRSSKSSPSYSGFSGSRSSGPSSSS